MGDAPGRGKVRDTLERVVAESAMPVQQRTLDGMGLTLKRLSEGRTVKEALATVGVHHSTYAQWRRRFPAFSAEVDRLLEANQAARSAASAARRQTKESLHAAQGLAVDLSRPVPPRPSLIDFRWDVLGRPTPLHQQLVAEALDDPTNLYTFVFGPTGPQPLDAPVLTDAGWRCLGDVEPGDAVYGRDGTLKPVLDVFDAGVRPVLEVEFDDGTTVRAAPEHQWTAKARTRRRRGWHVVSTRDFAAKLTDGASWNWQVPLPDPIESPDADLPLDPYVVGVLLGDGCLRQNSPKFTTADQEIADRVAAALPDCRIHQVSDIHWHIYADDDQRPSWLRRILDGLGMWGEYAHNKQVPDIYMRGSLDQRLDLLAGLMDTGGSVDEGGRCTFVSTSLLLVEDVVTLVRSVGGWAGRIGVQRREGRRPYYQVSVAAAMPLFSLQRKQIRQLNRVRAVTKKVVAVRRVDDQHCVCLRVEGEHYVTSGYTVTHNSGKDTIAGDFVLQQVMPDREGLRVAWFMESEDFSRRRMMRLARYLTDEQVYRVRPAKTPGGQVPTVNGIATWGPFKWEKGMVGPDGKAVERPQWTKNAMYFLSSQAPEADPNLWATGVGGATFGARIDLAVLSDVFTVENQRSPTERQSQYGWIEGTLDTRLDENGRMVVIGTMLPDANNYERFLTEYTADALVLSERTVGPATYTKYSNGVAVVMVRAIYPDPESGEPRSYWPDRFPLEDTIIVDGQEFVVAGLDADELNGLLGRPHAKRVRGLYSRQKRSPRMFLAMFQQERELEIGGDFTDAVLDLADDPHRTYGQAFPHELLVVGVDPARTGGAAWVLWAIDQAGETATVVDWFYGEKLGVTGIKQRLIIEPLSKWSPAWLAYETNMEASVLDDYLIQQALQATGTAVHKHRTGDNRFTVGSMAAYMRSAQIRFPAKTAEDRERTGTLKAHFKAWESRSLADGRARVGKHGREPDDLCMAAWIGWTKGWTLVGQRRRHQVLASMPVPQSVKDRWARVRAPKDTQTVRGTGADAYDLIEVFIGDQR